MGSLGVPYGAVGGCRPPPWLCPPFPPPGKCPKPLKNRDVVTLRSWLPMGDDFIIINRSVKHPVRVPGSVMGSAYGVGFGVTKGGFDGPVAVRPAGVPPEEGYGEGRIAAHRVRGEGDGGTELLRHIPGTGGP